MKVNSYNYFSNYENLDNKVKEFGELCDTGKIDENGIRGNLLKDIRIVCNRKVGEALDRSKLSKAFDASVAKYFYDKGDKEITEALNKIFVANIKMENAEIKSLCAEYGINNTQAKEEHNSSEEVYEEEEVDEDSIEEEEDDNIDEEEGDTDDEEDDIDDEEDDLDDEEDDFDEDEDDTEEDEEDDEDDNENIDETSNTDRNTENKAETEEVDEEYAKELSEYEVTNIIRIYDDLYESCYDLNIPVGMVLVDGLLAIDTHGKHSFQRRAFFDKLYEIIKKSCNGITLTQSTVNKETLTSDNTFPYRNGTNYYPRWQIDLLFGTFVKKDNKTWSDVRTVVKDKLSDIFVEWVKKDKDVVAQLKESLTTAIVVTYFESGVGIKLKVNVGSKRFDLARFMRLYGQVSTSIFGGNSKIVRAETVGDNGIAEIDIAINEKKMVNKTLFAHEAIEMLKRKNTEPSIQNCVLGESISGKTIKYNFDMDFRSTIGIAAAARCGKGVLTLNLVGTMVASENPVIYMDSKPDMARLLFDVCKAHGTQGAFYDCKDLFGYDKYIHGVPNDVLNKNPGLVGCLVYVKIMLLASIVSQLRMLGQLQNYKRPFFILDEMQAFQDIFESCVDFSERSNMSENKASEDDMWCIKAGKFVRSACALFSSALVSQMPAGKVTVISLRQDSQMENFKNIRVCGKTLNPLSRLVKASKVNIYGKGQGNAQYGTSQFIDKEGNLALLEKRRFVITDSSAGSVVDKNQYTIFKPYMVLNYSGKNEKCVREFKAVLKENEQDVRDYTIDGTEDGDLDHKCGFEGFMGTIGDNAIAGLSLGRQMLTEALSLCGLNYNSLEEYLFSCDDEGLTIPSTGGKFDNTEKGLEETEKNLDLSNGIDLGNDKGDKTKEFIRNMNIEEDEDEDDEEIDLSSLKNTSHVEREEVSNRDRMTAVNRSKASEMNYSVFDIKGDNVEDLINNEEVDEVEETKEEEREVILDEEGNVVENDNTEVREDETRKTRENESNSSKVNELIEGTGIENNEQLQKIIKEYKKPSSYVNSVSKIFDNKDGKYIVAINNKNNTIFKIDREKFIESDVDTENLYKKKSIQSKIYRTINGAQSDFDVRFSIILNAIEKKFGSSELIHDVRIYENEMYIDRDNFVDLSKVIGGRENIELKHILNYKMLFDKFKHIRTLELSTVMLDELYEQFDGDAIVTVFEINKDLRTIYQRISSDRVYEIKRKQVFNEAYQKEKEEKQREAEERQQLLMFMKNNDARSDKGTNVEKISMYKKAARFGGKHGKEALRQFNRSGITMGRRTASFFGHGILGVFGGIIGIGSGIIGGVAKGIKGSFEEINRG